MNKITLLGCLLTVSLGYSQINPIDFETIGNTWTWSTFEAPPGESNPTFSIVPNPSVDAVNGSATVAKIDIAYGSAEGWGSAGCESMHGSDIGTFTFTAANSTVTMMVYQVGFASPVALKFANASSGALGQVIVNNTVADAWVEVTFDMSAWIGSPENPVDQIIFYPSHAPRAGGHVIYFDNINFGVPGTATCTDGIQNGTETGIDCGGACPNACVESPRPMVSAPTPTPLQSQVNSKYSDDYTNTVVNSFANPGSSFASPPIDYVIPGSNPVDHVKGYDDVSIIFINWDGAPPNNVVDATVKKYFHIDLWSANATSMTLKMENQGPNLLGEQTFAMAPNVWNSIEIDLSTFGTLASTRDAIFHLVITGAPTASVDFFFDNLYFSEVSTLGVADFEVSGFKAYPNPTGDHWMISSGVDRITSIELFDVLGKQVLFLESSANEVSIDGTRLKAGLYFARITTNTGMNTIQLIKK